VAVVVEMHIRFDLPDWLEPADTEEKEWLENYLLREELVLHSNIIGDSIAEVGVVKVELKEAKNDPR